MCIPTKVYVAQIQQAHSPLETYTMDFFPNKVVRTDEQCYLNIICNHGSKWMWSQSPSIGTAQLRARCFVVVHWVAFRRVRWKGYKDVTAMNTDTDLLSAIYVLKILCIVLAGIPLL